MEETELAGMLEEHPRTAGVLFTVVLLLMHAGSALAGGGSMVGP
jgi:hypothetical protein